MTNEASKFSSSLAPASTTPDSRSSGPVNKLMLFVNTSDDLALSSVVDATMFKDRTRRSPIRISAPIMKKITNASEIISKSLRLFLQRPGRDAARTS